MIGLGRCGHHRTQQGFVATTALVIAQAERVVWSFCWFQEFTQNVPLVQVAVASQALARERIVLMSTHAVGGTESAPWMMRRRGSSHNIVVVVPGSIGKRIKRGGRGSGQKSTRNVGKNLTRA